MTKATNATSTRSPRISTEVHSDHRGVRLDLDRYVPGLLLWLSNKVSASATQAYRARFHVGVTDWRLLAYFVVYPWSTAARACRSMGLDKAAVSRSIAFLQRRDLLEGRPDGLRRVQYRPSTTGRRLHDEIFKLAMAREAALLDGFSRSEREVLIRMLQRMLANLGAVSRAAQKGN